MTMYPMSEREIRNAVVAREAAAEGMVLLENRNNTLPLPEKVKKIAFWGSGAVRTVRGGTGSGDPFNGGLSGGGKQGINQSPRYHINIMDSFIQAGYTAVNEASLREYAVGYDEEEAAAAGNPMLSFRYPEYTFTKSELDEAAEKTDTAIYVISRICGEGADRNMTQRTVIKGITYTLGDYELSQQEKENLQLVAAAFPHMIVILNVGGVIHMDFLEQIPGIGAVLYMSQGGQEGGDALLDIVTGKVTPSGKLTATWARKYADYPASATFADNDGDVNKELYTEGIYVGYRYFDTFGIAPFYEFGYGLSYADLSIGTASVKREGEWMTLQVSVENKGTLYAGKEVVQVYYSAPREDEESLEQPFQELAAFQKTKLLKPGEKQTVILRFQLRNMASYNEKSACYELSAGDYIIRVGNSSRKTTPVAVIQIPSVIQTEILHNQYPLSEPLKELSSDRKPERNETNEIKNLPCFPVAPGELAVQNHISCYEDEHVTTYTQDTSYTVGMPYETVEYMPAGLTRISDVYEGKASLEQFISQLSLDELAELNCGTGWGVANEDSPIIGGNSSTVAGAAGETSPNFLEKYDLPSIVLADGPGGVRVCQEFEAKDIETGNAVTIHQYCTAWPIGVSLGQSFDTELLYKVGTAVAEEMEEIGITIFLGPGMNIHRDPLCGRNFEYYSEDPLVSGILAAAITKGIQSRPGTGACIKHFAANNQESNRNQVDTIVGERALREIYLKGFEIAVRTAQPMAIMTAYNQINGIPAADSYDLNTNIARGEWGFAGTIMTDWNGGLSTPYISMHASNDLIMPGGFSRIKNIMLGVEARLPVFDDKGQIALQKEKSFIELYLPLWNSFTVGEGGKDKATAELHGDYKAEEKDGQILVNCEPVYLDYALKMDEKGLRQEYTNPVTTKFAQIAGDGKQIIYDGTLDQSSKICLGDVQRCAMNNIRVIMKSINMQKLYPQYQIKSYAEDLHLETWIEWRLQRFPD